MSQACSRHCFNDGTCGNCVYVLTGGHNSSSCTSCTCVDPWFGERCHKRKPNLRLKTTECSGAQAAAIIIPLLAIALIAVLSALILIQWRRRLAAHQRHVEHRILTEEVDMGIDAI